MRITAYTHTGAHANTNGDEDEHLLIIQTIRL